VYEAIGQGYEEFIQTFDNAVHVERAIVELNGGLAAITQQIEDPHVRSLAHLRAKQQQDDVPQSAVAVPYAYFLVHYHQQTGVHAALVKPSLELAHITQQAALTDELIETVTVLSQVLDHIRVAGVVGESLHQLILLCMRARACVTAQRQTERIHACDGCICAARSSQAHKRNSAHSLHPVLFRLVGEHNTPNPCIAYLIYKGELIRKLPTKDQDTHNVPVVFIAVKVL
jgi:hypothetical protein